MQERRVYGETWISTFNTFNIQIVALLIRASQQSHETAWEGSINAREGSPFLLTQPMANLNKLLGITYLVGKLGKLQRMQERRVETLSPNNHGSVEKGGIFER